MLYKGFALANIYSVKNINFSNYTNVSNQIFYNTSNMLDNQTILNNNDSKLIYVEIFDNRIHKYINDDKYIIYRKFCANNTWIFKDEILVLISPREEELNQKKDHIIINIMENLKLQ